MFQLDVQEHAVSRRSTASEFVAQGRPLMTWALREVPNATTGVSPYMYGRVPRGPLVVLKTSWTGERDVSLHWGRQSTST